MAKHIEAEYLSVVEQIIIASDDRMNILYNNYHEKFYTRIIKKCGKSVNMKYIRMKNGATLNRCFTSNRQKNLETERSTLDKILKMSKVFKYDEQDDDKLSHFRSLGILGILNSINEYSLRIKRAYLMRSSKQIDLEEKLNQIVPLQLIVRYNKDRIRGLQYMIYFLLFKFTVNSAQWS